MDRKTRKFNESTRVLFLKHALIPIVLLMIIFGIGLFSYTAWQVKHDTQVESESAAVALDEIVVNYDEGMSQIATTAATLRYLTTREQSNKVFEAFYHFNQQQTVKSVLQVVDLEGRFLTSAMVEDSLDLTITNYRLKRWQRSNQLIVEAETINLGHEKKTVLLLAKPVKDGEKLLGYVVCRLQDDYLQQLFFENKADILVVTDAYDRIVSSNNTMVRGLMGKFSYQSDKETPLKLGDKKYQWYEKELKHYPLKLTALVSEPNYLALFYFYCLFTFVMSGVLFVLLMYLSKRMSHKQALVVNTMITAMDYLKTGELNQFVEIQSGDEFELLAQRYNEMLESLEKLQARNEKLTYMLQRDEITFLQSQFNPHFLFNMLETIRYTMVVNQDKAQRIILSLSRLLRYSINQGHNSVKLSEDMNYIDDYLSLHAIRYNQRLTYTIDIPAELKAMIIPKLIIQPIIENSIKYGYDSQTRLAITIRVEREGSHCLLTVVDDGGGITSERLKVIQQTLTASENRTNSVGLYNTHRRICLMFGSAYGLTIKSEVGKGTCVQIRLPLIGGDEGVKSITGR